MGLFSFGCKARVGFVTGEYRISRQINRCSVERQNYLESFAAEDRPCSIRITNVFNSQEGTLHEQLIQDKTNKVQARTIDTSKLKPSCLLTATD